MCEFSGKLIAWMDGELREGETAFVERHLDGCAECRSRLATYRQASSAFDAYCDASIDTREPATAPEARRGIPQWMPIAAGVAAAVVALLLLLPRDRVGHGPVFTTAATTAPSKEEIGSADVSTAEPAAADTTRVKGSRQEHVASVKLMQHKPAARGPVQSAELLPAEPAIEITIPSDAVFPPGAVPEGVSFVADVTLGADGSAERLRLEPQLVKFEGGTTRP